MIGVTDSWSLRIRKNRVYIEERCESPGEVHCWLFRALSRSTIMCDHPAANDTIFVQARYSLPRPFFLPRFFSCPSLFSHIVFSSSDGDYRPTTCCSFLLIKTRAWKHLPTSWFRVCTAWPAAFELRRFLDIPSRESSDTRFWTIAPFCFGMVFFLVEICWGIAKQSIFIGQH